MITHNFNTLDLLTSPVWIVSPFEEQLIYANSEARLLMQDLTFSQLRTGPYSVSSQKELPKYLSDLQNQHDIIEILTVQRKEEETALSCRLVLRELTETEPVIIFEGIEAPATLGLKASRSANYQRKKQGFYARFFLTNSAPMLLIDPHEMAKSSMLTSPRSIFMVITMKRCARNIPGKLICSGVASCLSCMKSRIYPVVINL
ncbi:Sensory box-containing diguanylate cyclase [Escherichia coli]|nr:Sensory box-containing diguanylate cyclase [Escherichia coli]